MCRHSFEGDCGATAMAFTTAGLNLALVKAMENTTSRPLVIVVSIMLDYAVCILASGTSAFINEDSAKVPNTA